MKTYKIKKDGFDLAVAKGKKQAVEYLERIISWDGVVYARWGKFNRGVLKVNTLYNEFTIEEAL